MEKVKSEEDEGSDYEDGQSTTMRRRVMCAQHSPTQDIGTDAWSFTLKNVDTKSCLHKTTYNI